MKKLGKILTVAGAVTGIVYLTKKIMKTNPLESENRTGSRGTNKSFQNRDNEMKGRSQNRSNATSLDSNTRGSNAMDATSDYSNERTQKMYKDLGMTETQRRQYEQDYRTVMETWKKKNPNVSMDTKMEAAEHNSALKAILNEAQYSIYRDFENRNPK